MKGMLRQYPVSSKGMQNLLIMSSLALSRNGKQRHSFTPQSTITNQKILPAWKMLFAYPFSLSSPCSTISDYCGYCNYWTYLGYLPLGDLWLKSYNSWIFYREGVFLAFFFLRPQYMRMQETVLTRQARKPIKNDQLMPHFLKVHGVTNTLSISPTSGRMNTTPAYLPIQEEAMLPWIIYRISAPIPSKTRPLISSSQQWLLLWEPKMATKSWPRLRTMAPPQRRALAYFQQQKPMGMMKRMETALGMEQRRLNSVMVMLWIVVSSFCMVCVWLSTKLWPNIMSVRRIPKWIFFI